MSPLLRLLLRAGVLSLYALAIFIPLRPDEPPAAKKAPDRIKILVKESRKLVHAGEYRAALAPARELVERFPRNGIYREQLADVYRELGDFANEVKQRERRLEVATDRPQACLELAQAYGRAKMFDRQLTTLEQCVEMEAHSDTLFYLARAYEKKGDLERARATYRRGMEVSPDYADMKIGLARSELRLRGDAMAAKRAALEVLAKKPDYSDALFVLAIAQRREGDRAAARKTLERGIEVSPSNGDFYSQLAEVAEQQKDWATALRCYEKLLELRPADTSAAARIEEIRRRL